MPAKKKPITVSPKIPVSNRAKQVADLSTGDFFLYNEQLNVLVDADPRVINIPGGETFELDYDDVIIPVNVEIKWSYKK